MGSTQPPLKIIVKGSDGTTNEITVHPVDGKFPSTIEIASPKVDALAAQKEYPEGEMGKALSQDEKDPEKGGADAEAPKKKERTFRTWITLQQFLTALTSTIILCIMVLTLDQYRTTQNVAGAWPPNAKLYPTLTMLSVAVVTLIADFMALGGRFCGGVHKQRTEFIVTKMRASLVLFQTVLSASGATVFKVANVKEAAADLWGWSCTTAADQFASVNKSGTLCQTNAGGWGLSLLQTVLQVISLITLLVNMRKPKAKGGDDKGGKDARPKDEGKDGKDGKGGVKDNGKFPNLDVKQITAVVEEGQTTYTAVAKEYDGLTATTV